MFLANPLPEWKQIFGLHGKSDDKFFMENKRTFLFSESCISIQMVLEAYKEVNNCETVNVLLPDFFCGQTIEGFRKDWMNLVYYPIGMDLEPQWDSIKLIRNDFIEKNLPIDVFIFTHYFGVYHRIEKAKEFCKINHALLIEDCAHVLYKYPRFGESGDFVIYSCHKLLPIPDGAILEYNRNDWTENIEELALNIMSKYEKMPSVNKVWVWYLKKSLQKIFRIHRKLSYFYGIHFWEWKSTASKNRKKISSKSYNVLRTYDYEKIKRIAYIRRNNRTVLDYIIKNINPGIKDIIPEDCHCPYYAVYSLAGVQNPMETMNQLISYGFTIQYWPDLPVVIKDEGGHEQALELSKSIFTVPIHQGITPQSLIKKFDKYISETKSLSDSLHIRWDDVNRNEWEDVFGRVKISNATQEWIYGDAKSATEPWKLQRALILNENNEKVGVLQVLLRHKFGVVYAVRINRGPLFIPQYDTPQNHFQIMDMIRKHYLHPIPIAYAPFMEFSAENLRLATKHGWKCVDMFGFPSSVVDITPSEEELRKNLKSFWRKNLKHAQEQVTIKIQEYDEDEIIRLYNGFLEMRDIPGIKDYMLRYLFDIKDGPLVMLTAHNDKGEMIAYKGLYVHGTTGTSYIAWNTDEGRAKQARTLLIFKSALYLKEHGCSWYDLAGVDDICTEAIARFKRGMNGRDYILLGEFVRF